MKIAYIGSSTAAIQALKKWENHQVLVWFCDAFKEGEELNSLARELGVTLVYFTKEADIENYMAGVTEKLDYFVVYKTSTIIHQPLLDEYSFYNFHPGSLATNRGAYPLVWSILLGEKDATMSLHKIEAKIDAGPLLLEVKLPINEGDTPQSLEVRLEAVIPQMLYAIDAYRENRLEPTFIENGIYRRKIQKADYTIHFESDSLEEMICKINSQRGYQGAVLMLGEEEFRCFKVAEVDEAVEPVPVPATPTPAIVTDDAIYLTKNNRWYRFDLTKN